MTVILREICPAHNPRTHMSAFSILCHSDLDLMALRKNTSQLVFGDRWHFPVSLEINLVLFVVCLFDVVLREGTLVSSPFYQMSFRTKEFFFLELDQIILKTF